jgi:hypothetical protein
LQSLAERQGQFAAAILDPDLALPPGLRSPHQCVPDERFAVYRNNVAVGLIEALRCAFPVVNQLVGDEFFGAMARVHALRCSPNSPVLLAYGAEFPAFIADFEPVAALPYLGDVARLEWLWLEAYHAEDAVPLAIADLRQMAIDNLPGLRLVCHPSVRYAQFAHPALTLWRAHQGNTKPAVIKLHATPERLLVVRPHAHVEVIALSSGALAFLEAVERGGTIAAAVSAAVAEEPALAVAEMFSLLFGAGVFAGFGVDRALAEAEG